MTSTSYLAKIQQKLQTNPVRGLSLSEKPAGLNVVPLKTMPETLSAIYIEKINAAVQKTLDLTPSEILWDNQSKMGILAHPTFLDELSNGIDKAMAVLPFEIKMVVDPELKVYFIGDNKKQLLSSVPPYPKGELRGIILTPEEVLTAYKNGSKPPIGSLIKLNGGEVEIGCTFEDEYDAGAASKPAHRVFLDGFLISPFHITIGQFNKFVSAGGYSNEKYWSNDGNNWKEETGILRPRKTKEALDENTILGINYYEAEAFLSWAGLRFLTEHEWEYAARGGLVGKLFPWGNERKSIKEIREDNTPNGYGLFNIVGKCFTWTADWSDEFIYEGVYDENLEEGNFKPPEDSSYYMRLAAERESVKNPIKFAGSYPVIRGGSTDFNLREETCKVFYRYVVFPQSRASFMGLHPAMNI